jgi:hypothetical protein
MQVQEYLRQAGGQSDIKPLDKLKSEFGISYRFHQTFPNLVLLKYSQIESPMGEKIVQECRGLILDSSKDWEIVSRPYDKFFNHGEGHAASLDLSTTRAQEKLDGSLMNLFYYQGMWRVATSGSPDASGDVHPGFDGDFSKLFWSAFHALGYHLPGKDFRDYSFLWELETKYNRIVVQRGAQPVLTLHGVRHKNGHELHPGQFAYVGWKTVKEFPFEDIQGIVRMAEDLNPVEQEGFILVDANFNRVKIKSSQYVRLHHMRDQLTPAKMVGVVVNAEGDEFLVYFPEWTELFNQIQAQYDDIVDDIKAKYQTVKGIENQKEFALAIADYPHKGCLFALRAGKVESIQDYIRKINKPETLFNI